MNFDRPYNPAEHGDYQTWQDATAPELERLARPCPKCGEPLPQGFASRCPECLD